MAEETRKIIILDRAAYEEYKAHGQLINNQIYFIRESVSETSKMVSLCIGEAIQADLLDITNDVAEVVDFSDETGLYIIPEEYRITGKLWFIEQTANNKPVYHVIMWNGARFVDCFGEPNNLVICSELPETGATNCAYIVINAQNGNRFCVYNGTTYIDVLSVTPDNVTIKFVDNQLAGIGAFGTDAAIGGVTYTAQPGSEIFNYVKGATNNNIAVGSHSSASGAGNTVIGDYSESHNVGSTSGVTTPISQPSRYSGGISYAGVKGFGNNTFGQSNSIRSDSAYCSFISGAYNDIDYNTHYATFIGYNNYMQSNELTTTSGSVLSYFTAVGADQKISCGGVSENIAAIGNGNVVIGNNLQDCYEFGRENSIGAVDSNAEPTWISEYMQNIFMFGSNNTAYNEGSNDLYPMKDCYIFGSDNNISATYASRPNGTFMFGNNLTKRQNGGGAGFNQFIVGEYNPQTLLPGPKKDYAGASDGWKTTDWTADSPFVVAAGTGYNPSDWNTSGADNVEFYLLNVSRDNNYWVPNAGNVGVATYGENLKSCAAKGVTHSGDFMATDGTTLRPLQFMMSTEDLQVSPDIHTPHFGFFPENTSEYTFKETIKSIVFDGYMDEMAFEVCEPHRYGQWVPTNETYYTYWPQHVGSTAGLVDGYSCVLMFRPTADATVDTLIQLIPGSGAPTRTQTNLYIMNPDFDLSSVTVVHAFLYLDGFRNMCVIYSGYNENT